MTNFAGNNTLLVNCNDIDRTKLDAITQKAAAVGIEHTDCANVRHATVQTDYASIPELQNAARAATVSIASNGQLDLDTSGYNKVLREVKGKLEAALKHSTELQQAITEATPGLPANKPATIKLDGMGR